MSKPKFDVCKYLTVYRDMGHDPNGAFGFSKSRIVNCECELYLESGSCKRRGSCLFAREDDTWKRISINSFKELK